MCWSPGSPLGTTLDCRRRIIRYTTGTLSDLTAALNEAIIELSAPLTPADGTLASATSQLNALLVWDGGWISPATGTLASAVATYNEFVRRKLMAITYPVDCDTVEKRWRYVESFLEEFRLVHNVIGLWYRDGLTLNEYNNGVNGARIGASADITVLIPARLKGMFSYQAKLSNARWDVFVQWHANARSRLHGEQINYVNSAKVDKTWPHNYDEL